LQQLGNKDNASFGASLPAKGFRSPMGCEAHRLHRGTFVQTWCNPPTGISSVTHNLLFQRMRFFDETLIQNEGLTQNLKFTFTNVICVI
jgi:hypothetical protein